MSTGKRICSNSTNIKWQLMSASRLFIIVSNADKSDDTSSIQVGVIQSMLIQKCEMVKDMY